LTRRHSRRQPLPTPSNRAPCRKQRRRGHRQPSPRASHNKARAYAAHLLPPAPQPLPWGWGCGCSLYPPPPARPAALHASKPRLPASSSAAEAQARLRHAPASIYRAPVVSTGCNRHAKLDHVQLQLWIYQSPRWRLEPSGLNQRRWRRRSRASGHRCRRRIGDCRSRLGTLRPCCRKACSSICLHGGSQQPHFEANPRHFDAGFVLKARFLRRCTCKKYCSET
jgi:hypothetical protein